MLCCSVKPQTTAETTRDQQYQECLQYQNGVFISPALPQACRQPPQCHQDASFCCSWTLCFGLPGGELCSLSPTPLLAHRGHFNTAAFACRVIVVGKYVTAGLQLAASMLCCSTATVGFTSAIALCGNEMLPQHRAALQLQKPL